MKALIPLVLAVGLSGCSWFKDNPTIIADPTAEAIKNTNLQLDPLPPLDLSAYKAEQPPLYIKNPQTPGTKFEVTDDWIQKHEQLLIELESRIRLHEERDAINKETLEKIKKIGEKKPD